MKRRLRTQLILWLWGASALLFILLSLYHMSFYQDYIIREVSRKIENETRYFNTKFQDKFLSATVKPQMSALFLELVDHPEKLDLERYLRSVVVGTPVVFGASIAFETPAGEKTVSYPAPYLFKKNGIIHVVDMNLNEKYRYQDESWFRIPRERKQPFWTDVYYDKDSEMLLTTYSVPFFRRGKFAGVATVEFSLDTLNREILQYKDSRRFKASRNTYPFIINSSGRFVAFPDRKRILRESLFDTNKSLASFITSGHSGTTKSFDPLTGEEAWFYYSPLDIADYYLCFVIPQKDINAELFMLQSRIVLVGMLGLLLLLMIVIVVSNSITRPVSQLADGVAHIAGGNLDNKINVDSSTAEVFTLGESINRMIDDLRTHVDEIRQITADKERISSELSVAREIQLSYCPSSFSGSSVCEQVDISGHMEPAFEVGGDFYDLFFIDENHLGIVIGDASGKGIPAALFVGVSRAYLKSAALSGKDPGECLTFVNDLLCRENALDMFITLFYGILDTRTGEFRYANGGHNPPYMLSWTGEVKKLTQSGGIAAGVMEGVSYPTASTQVERGIVLYSDGIIDAMNGEREFYGDGRFSSFLKNHEKRPARELVESLLTHVKEFIGNAPQFDDITLVAITYRKNGKEAE